MSRDRKRPNLRGRPRDPRTDAAILRATLELIAEAGLHGASIGAIAARAGVARATIYRRWSTKHELVTAALATLVGRLQPPRTGSARTDVLALLRQRWTGAQQPPIGRVLAAVAAEALTTPSFLEVYLASVVAPRRRLVVQAIERGIARGELRPDTDPELTAEIIGGAILYYFLLPPTTPLPDDLPERIVDTVWDGITPR